MAEGNYGALKACISLVLESEIIDPQNTTGGGYGYILTLDALGIYGTDIAVFWNNICNKETSKMIAVLRAVQLGLFRGKTLVDVCHRQDRSGKSLVPVDELYEKVIKIVSKFDLFNRQLS